MSCTTASTSRPTWTTIFCRAAASGLCGASAHCRTTHKQHDHTLITMLALQLVLPPQVLRLPGKGCAWHMPVQLAAAKSKGKSTSDYRALIKHLKTLADMVDKVELAVRTCVHSLLMQDMALLKPSSTLLPNRSRRASLSLHACRSSKNTTAPSKPRQHQAHAVPRNGICVWRDCAAQHTLWAPGNRGASRRG